MSGALYLESQGEAKFMNHGKTIEYLNCKGNEVQMMHLGLHRTAAIMEFLGNPHMKYPSVHIAGTNGKGSVAAMIEAILREAGLDRKSTRLNSSH